MEQAPARTKRIYVYFAKIFVISSALQRRQAVLQKRRRPATEEDEFLSSVISRGNQPWRWRTTKTLYDIILT